MALHTNNGNKDATDGNLLDCGKDVDYGTPKLPDHLFKKYALSGKSNLEIVGEDGMLLEYVHIQTPSICMVAVGKNSEAVRFVKDTKLKIILEMLVGD